MLQTANSDVAEVVADLPPAATSYKWTGYLMPFTREDRDLTKWLSPGLAGLSLIVSGYIYVRSLREVHDFRAVNFGGGVLLINAGNCTETLASAAYLYGPPDWSPTKGGELGKPTDAVVLKPGDAQVIHVPDTLPSDLDPQFRTARHVAIQFLIVDTHKGYTGNKVFVETMLGFAIIHETAINEALTARPQGGGSSPNRPKLVSTGGSAPGPYDKTSYINLYTGEHSE